MIICALVSVCVRARECHASGLASPLCFRKAASGHRSSFCITSTRTLSHTYTEETLRRPNDQMLHLQIVRRCIPGLQHCKARPKAVTDALRDLNGSWRGRQIGHCCRVGRDGQPCRSLGVITISSGRIGSTGTVLATSI